MKTVLDASALLAYLQDEAGAGKVEKVLGDSIISAVNWSEVIQKASARGVDVRGLREELEALGVIIAPFTAEHGFAAGLLWKETSKHGLSLGDRACLCLGLAMNAPVLTSDGAWKKLQIGLDIRVLR